MPDEPTRCCAIERWCKAPARWDAKFGRARAVLAPAESPVPRHISQDLVPADIRPKTLLLPARIIVGRQGGEHAVDAHPRRYGDAAKGSPAACLRLRARPTATASPSSSSLRGRRAEAAARHQPLLRRRIEP